MDIEKDTLQSKLRDCVISVLSRSSYTGFSEKIVDIGNSEPYLVVQIEVDGLSIELTPTVYEITRKDLSRGVEKGSEDDDILIRDFCDSLIFYLSNPEYGDRLSVFDMKSTWRWIVSRCGVIYYPFEGKRHGRQ